MSLVGATMCRSQLVESVKMLRKIDQTATSVLDMFPDLELAVQEGEPTLAIEFFNMVKGWVVELKELVKVTQAANQVHDLTPLSFLHSHTLSLPRTLSLSLQASMVQIQSIVESSTLGLETLVSNLAICDSPAKAVNSRMQALSTRVENTLQHMSTNLAQVVCFSLYLSISNFCVYFFLTSF